MKFCIQLFILLLGFHVQATAPHVDAASTEPSFIDAPAQCLARKTYPCSLRVLTHFLAFERDSQVYHLSEKSALLFLSSNQVQLMQGQLWIRQSRELSLKLSSALKMNITGEWFVEKQSDGSSVVRNLNGEVQFDSKYVFQNEALPMGFQNWYGGIATNGQVARGVIRPIALADFLKFWVPLSGLSLAEAKKRAHEYRESWKPALDQSSNFYQQVIDRRLASQDEKIQKKLRQQKSVQQEREQLRQMYREKNGL